jgi:hypothetical protein
MEGPLRPSWRLQRSGFPFVTQCRDLPSVAAGVHQMATRQKQKPSKGWVYCRYHRVKNSQRLLDAHDYGYKAWRFPRRR